VTGRMTRRKGHHVVVQAAQHLKQRGFKDFVCVFTVENRNQSSYAGELWDLVLSTDTADVVRMCSPADDLPAAYAAATVVVSGAVQAEGLQRAILEALAMARPVVVSDLAAGPEVVQAPPLVPDERMSGLRVPAGDAGALAAALIRLLSLPDANRRAIGGRGRDWVTSHFDADTMIQQTLTTYGEVARSARR
jgi:glycosyltransferase involved in cell wall biosynthesis